MVVGGVAFAVYLVVTQAWNADAEMVGRMTFTFLFPAVVAGLVARGRGWGWPVIVITYVVLFGFFFILPILTKLRDR